MQEHAGPRTRILITLATYNERENLPGLIEEILRTSVNLDVLVIDDNSPDGTGQWAESLAETERRVHVLHRPGKLGLGTATMDAFAWALRRDYEFLLNMDADFSHHPRYIPALLEAMNRCDVAIGSRYVPGGGVQGWGLKRWLMSAAINLYARLLLQLSVKDTSGAFRCYRLAKLRRFDFQSVRSRGYSFQEEMLWHCKRLGCRFHEVPIIFEDRRFGSSKINLGEGLSALWILLRLGWFNLRGKKERRESDLQS